MTRLCAADLFRAPTGAARPSSDYDLNAGIALAPDRAVRKAAVLVAVREAAGCLEVILTKRASGLKHHPGQIAFPGGKVDAGDADAIAAALREAQEEIGLPPELVRVIAALPDHETVTGFSVTPVLALVTSQFEPVAEPSEVDEVFAVPLDHLADVRSYRIERRLWRGVWRSYYVVPYGPYYIWGATARILRALADRIAAGQ